MNDIFELNLPEDDNTYTYRSNLVDLGSTYYIRQIKDGSEETDFYFEIDFSESCRSSTLTPQSITLPDLIYNDFYQQEVPPFQDSEDPSYYVGACGEK